MYKQAIEFKVNFIKEHPELKDNVEDLFQLMLDEIEEGGSISHEIELFYASCKDLLID